MTIDLDGPFDRARAARYAEGQRILQLREERKEQSNPDGGLMAFIRYFWKILEPATPFVEGWPLECLAMHLEAITRGDTVLINGQERLLNRLLANVPPGFMKSLCVNVFWPAWEWGPMGMPHLRYVAFSYAAELTERDNKKFSDLICCPEYRELWGHVFKVVGDGKIRVTNDKTGFKFASSMGGVGTGERGDRVLCDDLHKVKGTETDELRQSIVQWVREGMSNRLNNLRESVIVIIMQRLHEEDTSGAIMKHHGDEYCQLIIPMEFESHRHFTHLGGLEDPRTEDGELAWPDRFGQTELASFKRNPFLWAGQYQQSPSPRGGGILKEAWWQEYPVPKSGLYEFEPLYTLASLDTAFKEKEENDFSALTVWSVYDCPKTNNRKVILTDAWQKRLALHGLRQERRKDEIEEKDYLRRVSQHWGLCEWVEFTCTKRKVNRLIIEDSARGIDVNNEIKRVFAGRNFGIVMVPARGDKWSRASAVVDIFTDEMVHAPGAARDGFWEWRDWAYEVIDQCAKFPRATHDDLVDSTVQALSYMRSIGLLIRRAEKEYDDSEGAKHRPLPKPLYQV